MTDMHLESKSDNFSEYIIRYITFWPFYLISLILFITITYFYLRYTSYEYRTNAKVEIIDKAQDSEMSLPTAMTVFNRSMINLENEVGVLKSFNLHKRVVERLNSNIRYFSSGSIKTSEKDLTNWIRDFELNINIDTNNIDKYFYFQIEIVDNVMTILKFDELDDLIESYEFESLDTTNKKTNLPFDLRIFDFDDTNYIISFYPVESVVDYFISKTKIDVSGMDSDQLLISMTNTSRIIADNYINTLIDEFDKDGISDRQLEYKRTIDFVDERSKILKIELEKIEESKQSFKQSNNITDLTVDATSNIGQKNIYNSDLFKNISQRDLIDLLDEILNDDKISLIPINIGIDNNSINSLIGEYNLLVQQRDKYMQTAGPNNPYLLRIEKQIKDYFESIKLSVNNYRQSVELRIKNLEIKELEFSELYSLIPENEKILRSIDRELEVKEALFLLLLQKREEAAINYAVVKPSIKVIDYARSSNLPVSPNTTLIILMAISFAFLVPTSLLFLWFTFDNKIHNKEQLEKLLNENIPVIAEIPFIKDVDAEKIDYRVRSVISESIRMLLSNLRFTSLSSLGSNVNPQTIIFTSSIKGEGKTLASVNTALSLANDLNKDKKVILLGTDLRNPQIHKKFGVEKNQKGISEIIYNNEINSFKKYIKRFDNLDVLFSGAIPPNPTALLSTDIFKNLISLLKNEYDYIIIDSAPCLLVSDTFQYIDFVDSVVFLFRSNFTHSKIINFINETYENKQIKNFNIVLNSVGNSSSYGYKYGYQYGYKYGYNYGYGYGYSSDN